jgi:hypothetical protein
MESKKKLHAQFVFIHQVLTQSTRYDINEFDVAKDAIKTITEMANSLGQEIKDATPITAETEAVSV